MRSLFILLLLCILPLSSFGQDLKVVMGDRVLLYAKDTLYAVVCQKDTDFVAKYDEDFLHLQDLLKSQHQTISEFGIYLRYLDIMPMEIERMSVLIDNINEIFHEIIVKESHKKIIFYGPITLLLRSSGPVDIKNV